MRKEYLPEKGNRASDNQFQDLQTKLYQSFHPRRSSTGIERNDNMNKSAVLTDKFTLRLSRQIPLFVSTKTQGKILQNKRSSLKSQTNILAKIAGASLASSNIRASNSDLCLDKIRHQRGQKVNKSKFPKEIVNILYRQGIKNYNPYLCTLNTLERYEDSNLSYIEKEYIKKLCFIGIAKKFVRNKKFSQTPQYSRTGVLIRTYMNDIISQRLQKKRDEEQQITIIQCNPTALSFNPSTRPKELQDYITKKKYAEAIKSVNSIITNEYKKYKLRNCSFLKNSPTYCEIAMYILVTILIFILVVLSPQHNSEQETFGIAAVIGLIFIGMISSWVECNKNVNQVHESTSMIDTTCRKIQNYFQTINNDVLIWKIGQDFYWIEIHNIKVHKRKFTKNNDDF